MTSIPSEPGKIVHVRNLVAEQDKRIQYRHSDIRKEKFISAAAEAGR